jgi:hypothetical protein
MHRLFPEEGPRPPALDAATRVRPVPVAAEPPAERTPVGRAEESATRTAPAVGARTSGRRRRPSRAATIALVAGGAAVALVLAKSVADAGHRGEQRGEGVVPDEPALLPAAAGAPGLATTSVAAPDGPALAGHGVLWVNAFPYARVLVDGVPVCDTPCDVKLPPGVHRVRAEGPTGTADADLSIERGQRREWVAKLRAR